MDQEGDPHKSVPKRKKAAQPNEELSMLFTMTNKTKANRDIRIQVHGS